MMSEAGYHSIFSVETVCTTKVVGQQERQQADTEYRNSFSMPLLAILWTPYLICWSYIQMYLIRNLKIMDINHEAISWCETRLVWAWIEPPVFKHCFASQVFLNSSANSHFGVILGESKKLLVSQSASATASQADTLGVIIERLVPAEGCRGTNSCDVCISWSR